MTSAARLDLAWRAVSRSARRAFLADAIADVTDGAHSLGELDVCWDDVGMVIEIDGGHHALALNPVDDALRQNERVVAGDRVMRIPVIGLRLAPTEFLGQARRMYDALAESRR